MPGESRHGPGERHGPANPGTPGPGDSGLPAPLDSGLHGPGRPGRHPLAGQIAAACAAAMLVVAGLLGTVVLDSHGGQPSAAGGAGLAATPSRSQPATRRETSTREVYVSRALVGRNVAAVRRELRARGLRVRLRGRADRHAPPGTVLLVSPTGKMPPGSVVVLTVATRPSPARSARPSGARPGGSQPGGARHAGASAPPPPSPAGHAGPVSPGRAKHGKGAPPGQ